VKSAKKRLWELAPGHRNLDEKKKTQTKGSQGEALKKNTTISGEGEMKASEGSTELVENHLHAVIRKKTDADSHFNRGRKKLQPKSPRRERKSYTSGYTAPRKKKEKTGKYDVSRRRSIGQVRMKRIRFKMNQGAEEKRGRTKARLDNSIAS